MREVINIAIAFSIIGNILYIFSWNHWMVLVSSFKVYISELYLTYYEGITRDIWYRRQRCSSEQYLRSSLNYSR